MQQIIIFCDGASKGNPGPGGWGAVVSDGTIVRELGGREDQTTNNKMELTAALEALSFASTLSRVPIILYTDSSYVINGITKWIHGWKRSGWLTKTKSEVLNKELWEELSLAVDECGGDVTWEYVGGHIGIAGNERADTIASDFAEQKKAELYNGSRKSYSVDLENISHDAIAKELKSSSRSRSRAKAYSYVSLVDGKIQTHKAWAECEARVRGKKARFKKATSAEEEKTIISEFTAPK
jgi:ribonuclease HI